MQNWARSDQATKFFNKQLPNLIQALNNNTQAVNALLARQEKTCQASNKAAEKKENK